MTFLAGDAVSNPTHVVRVADLSDELDIVTAALVETALDDALESYQRPDGGVSGASLVIDLTGIRLLSSAGVDVIEAFMGRARRCGVRPRLRMVDGAPPHRVFKALGLLPSTPPTSSGPPVLTCGPDDVADPVRLVLVSDEAGEPAG